MRAHTIDIKMKRYDKRTRKERVRSWSERGFYKIGSIQSSRRVGLGDAQILGGLLKVFGGNVGIRVNVLIIVDKRLLVRRTSNQRMESRSIGDACNRKSKVLLNSRVRNTLNADNFGNDSVANQVRLTHCCNSFSIESFLLGVGPPYQFEGHFSMSVELMAHKIKVEQRCLVREVFIKTSNFDQEIERDHTFINLTLFSKLGENKIDGCSNCLGRGLYREREDAVRGNARLGAHMNGRKVARHDKRKLDGGIRN